jgi:hypothetical protein
MTARFDEFTEAGFRHLVSQLQVGGYAFASFGERRDDRHVLWRHDIDVSVHRAARLAEIEADMGARATYFFDLRSSFYNLAEASVLTRARAIAAHGHHLGLHFSVAPPAHGWSLEILQQAVVRERNLIESILEAPVTAVSWHNPVLSNLLDLDVETIAGLANAYGRCVRTDYVYGSDSNGYWRFSPMAEVVAQSHPRLHLLTHPEWWTPEPMAPSVRVDRAIQGRARAVRAGYDAVLAQSGRINVEE